MHDVGCLVVATQTSEHLAAVEIMKLKNLIVLQVTVYLSLPLVVFVRLC